MLVAAGKDTNFQIEVWDLILAQHRYWRGRKETAEDVFNLLKLNNEGEQLFKSRILDVWVSYVVGLNKKNADEKYYSDERLEEMFVQAKNSIFTRGLAIKLEQEMWRSQGKTADDLYNFLKLDKRGFYDLFEGPAVVTWVSYATKLNNRKEHPVQFAVISELEKRFNYLDLA
ncbi:hypothetical protein JG688_00018113 [Phytophthora aleatoria]|uniref:RxLR effector protein n=1 Tax=Phytophthora aleatoria TaxID=2496075 RepID=A0A8J5HZZ6_9STRA|nr:hypothetical protein JG688_00018113 [Phytophthora aleatoria]